MVNKAKPAPDVLASWQLMLAEATEDLALKRQEVAVAEEMQRVCIREAFDAGLAVTPIREATGLSVGRLYQIKQGLRR
jgi:hypothetical protein